MVAKIMSLALVGLIILSLSMLLRAGKDVRKRPTTRATGNLADDPVSRSIAQWQKRSHEVLRLDCEQVHLVSTGSRAVLSRRVCMNTTTDLRRRQLLALLFHVEEKLLSK